MDEAMARQNHIFRKIRKGSQAEELANVLVDRPASSGVRHINTVGGLAERGMGLKISCSQCDHEETHKPDACKKTFGATTPLAEVRPDCSACGEKKTSVMPVSG